MAKKVSTLQRGLYKRGDVYYSRIAGPDGNMIRKRLSSDKQTAIIMLGELRKNAELARVGILPDNLEQEIKLCRHLKAKYIARLQSLGRSHRTIATFQASWKYLVENNKLDRIDQITLTRAQELSDRLRARGAKGQTINQYIGTVKAALDWARDFEYIRKNPLARWEAIQKDSPRQRRDFTPDEIRRFFAAEADELFRLRWMLYFQTGLRATAGSLVEWDWIRWNERELLLPAHANKSRVDHLIPLPQELFEALKKRKESLPEGSTTGYIFPAIETYQLRRRFRRICEKAGIDLRGLCLHSIRHTYATGSFEASGYNLKVVQELLCHADGATTMNYIHASRHQKRSASEEFAARLRLDSEGEERREA